MFCWLTLGWVYFRIAPDSPAREFGMSVVHICTAWLHGMPVQCGFAGCSLCAGAHAFKEVIAVEHHSSSHSHSHTAQTTSSDSYCSGICSDSSTYHVAANAFVTGNVVGNHHQLSCAHSNS